MVYLIRYGDTGQTETWCQTLPIAKQEALRYLYRKPIIEVYYCHPKTKITFTKIDNRGPLKYTLTPKGPQIRVKQPDGTWANCANWIKKFNKSNAHRFIEGIK